MREQRGLLHLYAVLVAETLKHQLRGPQGAYPLLARLTSQGYLSPKEGHAGLPIGGTQQRVHDWRTKEGEGASKIAMCVSIVEKGRRIRETISYMHQ